MKISPNLLKMVSHDFKVGDLVWAKMKGYPPWPAKIEEPRPDSKPPKQKKAHFVYFFGSDNYAWILDENISPHNESILLNLSKKKSVAYQNAITAFGKFTKIRLVGELHLPEENEGSSSGEEIENKGKKSLQMKVVKVLSSGTKVKERSVLFKAKRKVIRKRTHDDGSSGGCTVPKYRKIDNTEHPLVGSVPPNDDSSDIACIPIRGSSSQAVLDGSFSAHDLDQSNNCLQRKHVSASVKEFGFIGLGHIGRAVVLNLLNSGHSITVWNKTAYKCDFYLPLGAKIAHSPAELIVSCDITFCSVSDPNASKSLIFGEGGILKGLEQAERLGWKDRGYVEMTSIDPETSQQIAEAVLRKKGRYLEAPIFGNSKEALEGTLLVLASGDRRLFKDCETCFHAVGKHAYYIDCKLGFGNKLSLVLSAHSGTMYAAFAEAVVLIQRLGLDMNSFLKILEKGPLQCEEMLEKVQMMLKCNFRTITPLKHMQKDLSLSLMMGDEISQPMPITAAANEVYKHARLLKYSNCDVSAVYQAARY